jgi:ech hydrogenase subunit A
MEALTLLAVLVPALGAILVFFAPDAARRGLVLLLSGLLILMGAVLGLSFLLDGVGEVTIAAGDLPLGASVWAIDIAVLDIALMVFFIYLGWRARSPRSAVFAISQLVAIGAFEVWHGSIEVSETPVILDRLSLMLVLVTCIVGSLITIFAVHYMRDRPNRGRFFAFMLLFLAAMNGAVLSNDLLWLFFFWEVTTLCSYYLIYHDETEEAKASARLALEVTLGGGVALALAIVYAGVELETYELAELMRVRDVPGIILLLPALVVLAGMTKSAQLPFQGWLLGAMVAPTPVSALLHSSTMVNLGVYIILRAAPLIKLFGPLTYLVAGLGVVTFAAASLLAATQSNAKRLLAYSTISNLGLVVMCVGINTSAALVAGVFILLFHAISKGMLFLGVGVIDHELGTRDINEMGSLVTRMPRVTWVLVLGAVSMVLPPFGLFAGKWLSFEASTNLPVLILLLGIGSAATILYYTKWVGHLVAKSERPLRRGKPLDRYYALPLAVLSTMIVALSILTPFLASDFIFPSLPFGYTDPASEGAASLLGSSGYLWIAAIFVALAAGLALPMYLIRIHREDRAAVYSCGEPYEPVISSSFFGGERLARPLSDLAITLATGLLLALMLIPFLEEVL